MTDIIKKLMDSDTLVDILLQVEDFFDNLDLYAFQNWFDGTVIDGPDISRYWISIILMYDYDKMPDPAGALRLVNAGVKVEYKEAKMEDTELPSGGTNIIDLDQMMTLQGGQDSEGTSFEPYDFQKSDDRYKSIWLVRVTLPRQFVDDLNDITLDGFDSDVQQSVAQRYGSDTNDAPPQPPATQSDGEGDDAGDIGGIE